MEIWNHFTFRKDMHPLTTQYILNSNIQYKHGEILSVVDISENDPHWEELSRLLKLDNNTYLSETKFSKEELCSAEWLTVRSQWYYDYPQPENRYTKLTYSEENVCSNCGMGLVQQDSFRFKRTPKWGRRNFCMTNWVYDEFFVSPKAKELLESSDLQGFIFSDVLNKSGKETLADIYQMQIPYVLPEGIETSSNCIEKVSNCPICDKRKFLSNERGQFEFKGENFLNVPDFVKSAEQFGSCLIASRLILISQKAYKFIIENKLDSSLVFEPIKLV
jgi:hypothetical protein